MKKIPVVLFVLNKNAINDALIGLNFNNINLIAILSGDFGDKRAELKIDTIKIPIYPLSYLKSFTDMKDKITWLLSGFVNNVADFWKIAKLLIKSGVPKDNIVNFHILGHISKEWIGNIRYIEKNPVNYFATGISYTEVALDINQIEGLKGINLSSSNQDLNQGYLTAKYVFSHVQSGNIKFVLIGLAPYSLRYENKKAFSVCTRNLQYTLTLKNEEDNSIQGKLFQTLINDNIKNIPSQITDQQADPNYMKIKYANNKIITSEALINWETELKNLTKKFWPDVFKKNIQILEDYIKLCLDNGAKPIAVVWPFAPAMRENYDQNLLVHFRNILKLLEKSYDFKFIDLFDLQLGYDCFYNMAHLNMRGAYFSSKILNFKLYEKDILPIENLCKLNYNEFYLLSQFVGKDEYNNLIDRVFKESAKKIAKKDKIKVGFVMYDSSMWCGDDLYNLFDKNERYEPIVFLCLRTDQSDKETVVNDFYHGIEQFKAKNINVVGVPGYDADVPKQDILIFLTPYFEVLPKVFTPNILTPETLIVNIPYAMQTSALDIFNGVINFIIWKKFFDTKEELKNNNNKCKVGMPRGYYSGYPKMDIFFKNNVKYKYDWKICKKDAIKIVYAPHWSINEGVKYATFQHNYRFMYDYAKNHPEISWVFKPHPNLLFSAVKTGLFPSIEDFKQYLQDWDNLPNAKVETGAYYQEIFATSDAMILDSGSFISEYQYTHKPMLFLTRDTQNFNDLGNALMKVLYRVDGRDFNGISNFIENILIKNNDIMFESRMKFFNEHFNYKDINGILASEFIFKTIDDNFNKNR